MTFQMYRRPGVLASHCLVSQQQQVSDTQSKGVSAPYQACSSSVPLPMGIERKSGGGQKTRPRNMKRSSVRFLRPAVSLPVATSGTKQGSHDDKQCSSC